MQIGVVYPQIELGGDPAAVRRIGRATEELGFDHLLAYDHVLGAMHEDRIRPLVGPYTERDPFHDPLVMFGHVAAVTERIGFVTGILVLPQRQTALVARQAADVDLLSGGRLRLGVGIGWNHEYEALGENFGTRGAREEEQISLLRRLWTEPVVDFSGTFDRIDRAAITPKPTRPIPIWPGGYSDAAHERAARVGDGFSFGGRTEDVFGAWDRIRERVVQQGRPAESFGGEYVVMSRKRPEEVAAKIEAWHQEPASDARPGDPGSRRKRRQRTQRQHRRRP
jgi:probable F420-dependent oxidoreductase